MGQGQRIGYVRVSTILQNTGRQLDGVELDRVFTDKASGGSLDRPELKAAKDYLREGDTLFVHSLDRLARNTEHLLRTVRELNDKGVTVVFVKNQLTFSGSADPAARLMLALLGAFAEFERELILERQREGIAIAKTKGKFRGRAKALTPDQAQEVRQLQATGMAKTAIAKKFGITRQTVYQYIEGPTAAVQPGPSA